MKAERIIALSALCCGLLTTGEPSSAQDRPESWVKVAAPHCLVISNAGEKSARNIALQFEQIREVFRSAFPFLHVDPGKPTRVLGVRGEEAMRALLPEYWAKEGSVHPSGLYATAFDENFAILRIDSGETGDNAFRSLYHEYAHAVQRLNFREMPAWLAEGMADFFGNTVIAGNSVELGRANNSAVNLLRKSALIPLEELLRVDRTSSMYNEKDRASVFYAESWALVHYLSLDPEAAKGQPLASYFSKFEASGDPVKAAHEVFGDLQVLERNLQSYVGRGAFRTERVDSTTAARDHGLEAREIGRGEALAAEADFLVHTRHEQEAGPLLAEALALQPESAAAHTIQGYLAYVHFRDTEAQREFALAARLDSKDFRPPFYLAELSYRQKNLTAQSAPEIIGYLERAIHANPEFAPAYAFLSIACLRRPDTRTKALDAALKAQELEPTVAAYAAAVGNALMALHREDEARSIQETLSKSARTAQEKSIAREYARSLARHEEFLARRQAQGLGSGAVDLFDEDLPPDSPLLQPWVSPNVFEETKRMAAEWTETVEGEFRDADCAAAPAASVRFATRAEILRLATPNVSDIEFLLGGGKSSAAANPCAGWKGRKAKITYRAAKADGMPAEIRAIDFQ